MLFLILKRNSLLSNELKDQKIRTKIFAFYSFYVVYSFIMIRKVCTKFMLTNSTT